MICLTASNLALRTGFSPNFNSVFAPRVNKAAHRLRLKAREGSFCAPTSGFATGFVQTNVVMLQERYALDFLRFCLSNPKFCPLLGVTSAGQTNVDTILATDTDLRTDLPLYRIYRDGKHDRDVERVNSDGLWQSDLVTFFLGCSFSWEDLLHNEGLTPRHMAQQRNVPMYRTNLQSNNVGPFGSELVVSMRPYRPEHLQKVYDITAQYPGAHGSPLHWGDPQAIGIDPQQLDKPQWGQAVTIENDEVPVFWACGVSSQVCAVRHKF